MPVEWGDPPAAQRGPAPVVHPWVAELRSRPGAWAAIYTSPSKSAGGANVAALRFRKKYGDAFEFTARAGVVYGRYIGSGKEA